MENTHPQDAASRLEPSPRLARFAAGPKDPLDSNPWRDNHGNVLLGFTLVLCLIGSTILACRQTRFTPPSFPTNLSPPNEAAALGEGNEAATEPAVSAKPPLREIPMQILGAGSDVGTMRIAVYASPIGFNDPTKAIDTFDWRIDEGMCVGKLQVPEQLKRIAIAAYHDANANEVLDRNAIGIPSERYGFSNNARGVTGPPTFEEATIELSGEQIDISIR
jgi:uncharacterized protein (DUF2141 family)